MVDASEVRDAVVAMSIVVGVFFAVIELRNMRRDRVMDVMMRAAEHANTREFEGALFKIMRSRTDDAKELEEQVSYVDLCMVSDFYEHIAWLGTKGVVNKRLIVEYYPFELFWRKLRPWIQAERKNDGIPELYSNLEKLAHLQAKRQGS